MDDVGTPISYQVLEAGTPIYSSDGDEVGTVAHVLADEDADVFDGIVIAVPEGVHLPGRGRHRFVDAPEVEHIHERAVQLSITTAQAEQLPEPSANPAVIRDDPGDGGPPSKLQRAWDIISGNR